MILNKIDDPRDALSRARRMELFKFAQASGVTEIVQEMPATLMRQILRAKGKTKIQVPVRPLGAVSPAAALPTGQETAKDVPEVDADADLMRQFLQQQAQKPAPTVKEKPVAAMSMGELRAACKARGIKMDRRDTLEILRKKLNGQVAA